MAFFKWLSIFSFTHFSIFQNHLNNDTSNFKKKLSKYHSRFLYSKHLLSKFNCQLQFLPSKGFLCGEFLVPCNIHRKHHLSSNLEKFQTFSNGYSHASQKLHPPLSPNLCITSITIFCRWVF